MAKGGFPGGMGGMNMNNLMKQAQKMQKQMMEKQEELLWEQILVKGYIHYLFEPNKPERLRALLDIAPTHPLQDSSVAAYQHVTAAAVSYQRRRYAKILQEISKQLQK